MRLLQQMQRTCRPPHLTTTFSPTNLSGLLVRIAERSSEDTLAKLLSPIEACHMFNSVLRQAAD